MKNLMKSLADFQQECPAIFKSTAGFNYKYADLPSILKVINPLLFKHGLVLSQPLVQDEDKILIRTILYHLESGEMLESLVEIPRVQLGKMNDYQSLGSGITYFRRYSMGSILVIVTDEDTDAAGEQVKDKAKELPWLTQKMFDSSVRRIQEAKPNVHVTENGNDLELTPQEFVDKLSTSYRIKKDFKEALRHEVDFQNTLSKAPDKPSYEGQPIGEIRDDI